MEDQLDVALRPVTAEDDLFLFALYASTRAEELALVDWSAEEKQAFLQMQFAAQGSHYTAHFPQAQFDLILRNGREAGRLSVARTDEFLHIVDIALLPEHRNAGIATALISKLQNEAASTSKPLRLHVESFNPVWRLYERLGFQKVREVGLYWLMEWRAPEDMTVRVGPERN